MFEEQKKSRTAGGNGRERERRGAGARGEGQEREVGPGGPPWRQREEFWVYSEGGGKLPPALPSWRT